METGDKFVHGVGNGISDNKVDEGATNYNDSNTQESEEESTFCVHPSNGDPTTDSTGHKQQHLQGK